MTLEPEISIRLAQPSDIEAIHAIDHICFSGPVAYDMETFMFYLHDRSSETWVADSADGVVGFAIFDMGSRGRAHFITLDVLPKHRKKRVGSALMDHARERARARGASALALQVAVNNQLAMDFYERRGYAKIRLIKNYYGDNTDAWEMKLDLRKP